jgi:hypothetical protein
MALLELGINDEATVPQIAVWVENTKTPPGPFYENARVVRSPNLPVCPSGRCAQADKVCSSYDKLVRTARKKFLP